MTSVTAQPGPPPHVAPIRGPDHEGLPSLDSHTHDTVPRGPVEATMNFYTPPEDGSNPHNWVEKPVDRPQRNFGDEWHQLQIHDARGNESKFNLDKHAFATLQGYPHNPAINWDDDDSVKSLYYPEVERILLENSPGNPNKVLIFDHTVRRANPNAPRAPVQRCHIDQTAKSSQMRVEFHLSEEEAKKVLDNNVRYRIINVWRPINGTVESSPLGFANSATVPDGDMVPVEHRYPNRTGETAAVKYNPDHEWYYWSGMEENERIMLQCFDSANPGNRVPHSAFADPRNGPESKPRESIEVRALVFG